MPILTRGVKNGPDAREVGCLFKWDVCFTPAHNGPKSDIAPCPKSARSGSDKPIQIVSSARTRRDAETLVRGRTSLPGTSAVLSCRLG
jgi:hypothetical protein